MGLKFRKSIKMGPVRVNLSKSGVSTSVGVKGARVSLSSKGKAHATVGIPGTGISYSKSLGGKKKSSATKKTSTQSSSRSKNSCQNYTSNSSSGSGNGGCLKGGLWFLAFCLVISLISKYWKILLALAVIAVAAYIAYRIYRRKNTETTTVISDLAEPDAQISPISVTSSAIAQQDETVHGDAQSIEAQHAASAAQFGAELNAIPKVEIALSSPAERQLLKNLPEYSFSNITRTTRLDSIFPLVVLDVETTGLYPSKAEIIEVSAIKFDTGMKPVSCFTSLCRPKKPIPEDATAINNITDDMVKDYPSFAEMAPALTDFIQDCHLVGHNLDFDLRFIFAHGVKLPEGKHFYDTLDLAYLTIPRSELTDHKLNSLCFYYGIWRDNAHRSLSDCYATSKVFKNLVLHKTDRQLIADTRDMPESDT